jgi:hypothetical protein
MVVTSFRGSEWNGVWGKTGVYGPFSFGPLKEPPTMGMTTRSSPVGIGPREKRSPRRASMLYRSVILGAMGDSCAIVRDRNDAIAVRELRKCILVIL